MLGLGRGEGGLLVGVDEFGGEGALRCEYHIVVVRKWCCVGS